MRAATEQLPGFIFYLGAGAVLLVIAVALETIGQRVSEKRRTVARRRALRAWVWNEVDRIEAQRRSWASIMIAADEA